ncbi:caspase a-like isoform X1 [Gadus macrocephalus]|uniref:caspase a-like isoform X1 n=1 Tax=Gadus macrocephalus TaxID=80720 RepID=UPI0028CB8A03|nr:caspase a-like isoform X1 [Gadus macrocephalus]
MEDLKRIRSGFVGKVGLPALKGLLDDLWQHKVLSTDDKDTVLEDHTSRTDRARCLIDMVMGKGERASLAMIDCMLERDRELYLTLGLMLPPSPTDRVGSLLAGSQEVKASYKVSPTETKGRTSELILSSEQFKTEKLKDRGNIYTIMAPADRTRMALLITNVHFDKEKDRDGAEKDEQDMSKLLISLGYNVEQHRDLSGVEMDEAVKRFSKDPRLAATDSVFVVIMSHGVKGAILGVHHCDGVPDQFPIDNIYKHLDSARCPKLLNKPKVIIIQACRGVDDGSAIVCDGPGSGPEQAPVVQVDAALPPHLADEVDADIEEDAIHRVHKEKDMVSLLSCTADTVSYRHSRQGSFLIQHLVEIFKRHAHEDHIDELFRKVLKRFEDEPPSADTRQMAVKDRCTLTKMFYLFPGL